MSRYGQSNERNAQSKSAKSIAEQLCKDITTKQEDPAKVAFYFSDDATFMPPNHPSVNGKIGVRDYLTKQMQHLPGAVISWQSEDAFDVGEYVMTKVKIKFTQNSKSLGTGK